MSAFCRKCGAEMPTGAKFCEKCGSKVSAAANSSAPKPTTRLSMGNGKRQVEKLLNAIWVVIGLNALAGIIGLFDVREYYQYGAFGSFLFSAGGIALNVWLALAIAQRKNWARVTYIAYSLLLGVLGLLAFANVENKLVGFVNFVALAVNIYCVVMLFKQQIASSFVTAEDGVKCALIFWGVFVALIVFAAVCTAAHQSSRAYLNDCAEAAARGSEDAYSALMDYSIEHSSFSGSEAEVLDAAVRDVNEFIATTVPANSYTTTTRRGIPKAGQKTDWGKILKGACTSICIIIVNHKF